MRPVIRQLAERTMNTEIDDREWYAREFGQFVPPDVLDFGVRVAPSPESMTAEPVRAALSHALFDRPLRMHYAPADARPDTNDYVGMLSAEAELPGLWGFEPGQSGPETLQTALIQKRFAGILACSPDDLPAALPDWAMEIIDRLGRLVVLDVSLSDENAAWHVAQLCMQYPRAKFVVEAAGSYQTLTEAAQGLYQFKDVLNLFFTTAGVTEWQILESLFAAIEPHRILFATGGRRALERGKTVVINDYLVETAPEHTKDFDGDTPPFTLRLYEEVWAIRSAMERLGINRDHILDFFCDNAEQLLNVATRKP